MTTCMLIFGRVAAQHLAAGLANSQMHPAIANPNALFALKGGVISFWNQVFWRDAIQVFASHNILLSVNELEASLEFLGCQNNRMK